MVFFLDWLLWEKMCFVLGCLIVIVLIYGSGVHIYNSWRLKKYSAAAAHHKSLHESTAEMAQAGSADDDIPFGSRAIESGIEIEGIWISSHNTPVGSPKIPATPEGSRPPSPTLKATDHLSPNAAAAGGRAKSNSVSSPLPLPHPAVHSARTREAPVNGRRAKSDFYPRQDQGSVSEPYTPNNGGSGFGEGSLGSPVMHDSRYGSANSRQFRGCDSVGTNESRSVDFTNLVTASENNLHFHSRSGDPGVLGVISGNGQMRSISGPACEQGYLNPVESCRSIDEQQHGDLLPLHSHRRFHIAETGQLGSRRGSLAEPNSHDQHVLVEKTDQQFATVHAR
ncbi:hypothetical protein FQN55_004247 [Onygenales sp. PD_40]|nr:hypothetical protein FQN55_004247 [Onygenales sp. PD_40]KAK2783555.1 hypothetical protein FQN53_009178 [Emmonsiellopsis sp. PD_33]